MYVSYDALALCPALPSRPFACLLLLNVMDAVLSGNIALIRCGLGLLVELLALGKHPHILLGGFLF